MSSDPRTDARATHDERIAALQRMAIFGGVDKKVVKGLVDRAEIRELDAGEYFFRFGERGSSAFVLEAGQVEVVRDHEGQTHTLRTLETGDCFGEVALLDFGERSASVRALRPCRALELTARSLHEVANEAPEQFALIYMNLGRELSRRLREADERFFKARWTAARMDEGWAFGSG